MPRLVLKPVEGCKCLISCFENDGLQKKKSPHPLSGRKMRRFKQVRDCVAAFAMMVSIVFGSLLRQVCLPLL